MKRFLVIILLSLLPLAMRAGDAIQIKGSVESRCGALKEKSENQIISLTPGKGSAYLSLDNFSVFGYRNLGVHGAVLLDGEGNITGHENIVFTGYDNVSVDSLTGQIKGDSLVVTLRVKLLVVVRVNLTFTSY